MQQQRRRFTEIDQLEDRLTIEARRLREEAELLPPGTAREQALRKERQAETGSHISEWLGSPGLRPLESRSILMEWALIWRVVVPSAPGALNPSPARDGAGDHQARHRTKIKNPWNDQPENASQDQVTLGDLASSGSGPGPHE